MRAATSRDTRPVSVRTPACGPRQVGDAARKIDPREQIEGRNQIERIRRCAVPVLEQHAPVIARIAAAGPDAAGFASG
jgi:hypothetical protein